MGRRYGEEMNSLGIKAWYSGGRKFSTANSDPLTWPTTGGLLFIIYYKETTPEGYPYRRSAAGGDWFVIRPELEVDVSDWRDDGTWVPRPADEEGCLVVQGEYVSDEEYARAQQESFGDRVWP